MSWNQSRIKKEIEKEAFFEVSTNIEWNNWILRDKIFYWFLSELYSCKVLKYDIQVQIVHTNTDLKKGQIYVVPQVVPDLLEREEHL